IALRFEQQKAVADTLARLRYKVLTLKIETVQELFLAIREIGDATGSQQRAEELVNDIRRRISNLEATYRSADRVKVLWVVQSEPLRAASANTFINELIEIVGGENAIGATLQQYPEIGVEQLLSCGAEVVIQSAMGPRDMASQQKAAELLWSKWPSLPAVKNNRIYVVDPDTMLRLGPRLPQGVETVGRYLHPETPVGERVERTKVR
ncbi:MAG: ABC transporter substrate-binding protein, partial [Planctomycetota bacterium]